jgi:uncharacterized protein (TIGR02246 family)
MDAIVSPAAHGAGTSSDTEAMRQTFDEFLASWNKHNVKEMMSHWADDSSLINPMGRAASGKAEIEKIMADEQATAFRNSRAKVLSLTSKPVIPEIAWIDGEMTIDNALDQKGTAMPQMKIHIAGLMKKKDKHWLIYDVRPYAFITPEKGY